MSVLIKNIALILILAVSIHVKAASISWDGGASTTNWGDALNWSNNALPTNADDVSIIINNAVVVVNISNAACASLLLTGTGNNKTAELEFSASGQLTISGLCTLGGGGNNRRGNLDMANGGHLSCGGFSLVDNNLWTPGSGTIELLSTNTLPSSIVTNFNNVIISGGTTTLTANTTVSGTLTVRAGAVLAGATFTVSTPTSLVLEAGATTGASITGSGNLTLGGNITVNDLGTGSDAAAISCPIVLGATRTINVADDGTTATDLTISGVVSGAFGINKTGTGTLVLSASNTYTGLATISVGTLKLGLAGGATNTPLGTVASGTIVESGAVLDLNGFTLVTAEALSLEGSGLLALPAGALTNTGGNVSYSGGISLVSDATITATASGTLTCSGNIASGAFALTLDGVTGSTGTYSGVLSLPSSVTKNGAGTWILSGVNTYTGATIINAGVLMYGVNNALPSTNVTVNDGGTFNLNGFSGTIGALTVMSGAVGGAVTTGVGILTLGGNITSTGGAANAIINGNLDLGSANRTISVTESADELTIVAVISGNRNITKNGSGIVTLSGANTYTGNTTVSGGTLKLGVSSTSATSGPLGTAASGTTVNNGRTLDLNGFSLTASATEAFSIRGNGISGAGALTNTGVNATIIGDITLAGNTTIEATTSGTLTLAGNIGGDFNLTLRGDGDGVLSGIRSGTGNLTKNDDGAWTLSAANTYTGGTTLTNGSLFLGNNQSLGPSGNFDIRANTILDVLAPFTLNNIDTLEIGNFTFQGTHNLSIDATLVFLNGNRQVTVTANTLTIDGPIDEPTRNFTKLGAGTLSLGSSSHPISLNSLTISAGTLESTNGLLTLFNNFTNDATFNHNGGTIVMGNASQDIGGSTNPITFNNLTISNGSTTNLDQSITCAGDLTVESGTVLDFDIQSANRVTSGGILTVAGTLILDATSGGQAGSNFPNNFATVTLTGGTIQYNRTSGGQTIFATPSYHNLTLINTSGTHTVSGNLVVNGTLTTTSGGTLDLGSSALSGTLSGVANSGTLITSNTSATPIPNGKTWGGLVRYAAASGLQTIVAGTYNDLTLSNSGGTNSVGGDLTVNGTLLTTSGGTVDMSTHTLSGTLSGITHNGILSTSNTSATPMPSGKTWGGTVIYAASGGSQTSVQGTYNNLTFSNSSGTNTADGNLTVNGTLTTTSGGSLNMSTYQLLGSLTSVSNGGTIQTLSIANPPIPVAKTWNGTVNYAATTGAQTIAGAISYNNLTMSNTSVANTLGGAITVNGIFTMSGGKLVLSANTLTLNGTISGMSASSSLTANGASNIAIGGSGILGTNLFLDQTTPGVTNRLNNFIYDRASQTITLGDTIEIAGTITPTAGLLATANKLKLISNVSGTARVAAGSGSYITGDVTVERFIPSSARRWRFAGTPVSGRTMADLQDDVFVTGPGGAGNGFDVTLANYASIYNYDETLITGDFNTGWTPCGNITDPITVGKGYRVFIRGDRSDPGRLDGTVTTQNAVTVDLTGTLNAGDISLPVTYTSSGSLPNDGWNLVANPYASQIDWNAFHDAGRSGVDSNFSGTDYAHIKQTVYIFDGSTNSYTSYNALSNSGTGALSGGIIPAGAAFWVQAIDASPSLTLKEIYKTAATAAAIFKTTPEQFSVKLIMDNITSDEAAFKYIPESTTGFDAYDISKLYGSDVNIASIGKDGSFLSVNCKPFNGHSDTIPLSIGFAVSGQYKMQFSNTDGLGLESDKAIYLVDLLTQSIKNLATTSEYSFTVNIQDSSTFGNNRFMLVVGDVVTAIPEFEKRVSKANLYLYPTITTGNLVIHHNRVEQKNVDVRITDLWGKTIILLPQLKWINDELLLNLSEYPNGLYFISIIENNQVLQTLRCIKE